MNRRGFLKRLGAVAAGAIALANAPALFADAPTQLFDGGFANATYRGHKFVFDKDCPKNTVYFLDPAYHRAWDIRTGERLY